MHNQHPADQDNKNTDFNRKFRDIKGVCWRMQYYCIGNVLAATAGRKQIWRLLDSQMGCHGDPSDWLVNSDLLGTVLLVEKMLGSIAAQWE
jgi:hypothetical protein